MAFLIVPPQNILTKIIAQIAPDRVDVVRIILRIIVFGEKARSQHPIIMWPAALLGTRPCKTRRLQVGLRYQRDFIFSEDNIGINRFTARVQVNF